MQPLYYRVIRKLQHQHLQSALYITSYNQGSLHSVSSEHCQRLREDNRKKVHVEKKDKKTIRKTTFQ